MLVAHSHTKGPTSAVTASNVCHLPYRAKFAVSNTYNLTDAGNSSETALTYHHYRLIRNEYNMLNRTTVRSSPGRRIVSWSHRQIVKSSGMPWDHWTTQNSLRRLLLHRPLLCQILVHCPFSRAPYERTLKYIATTSVVILLARNVHHVTALR